MHFDSDATSKKSWVSCLVWLREKSKLQSFVPDPSAIGHPVAVYLSPLLFHSVFHVFTTRKARRSVLTCRYVASQTYGSNVGRERSTGGRGYGPV